MTVVIRMLCSCYPPKLFLSSVIYLCSVLDLRRGKVGICYRYPAFSHLSVLGLGAGMNGEHHASCPFIKFILCVQHHH